MKKNLDRLYRPPTDVKKYENEKYSENPLLNFHICEIKERRHYTFLHRKATADKVKLCRKPIVDLDNILPVKQSHYINKLREYADKIPIPRMLYHTENKILDYVPKRLREEYPHLVKDYMAEVHGEFDQIIKAYSLRKILVEPEEKPSDKVIAEEGAGDQQPSTSGVLKRKGKTDNYPVFLKNRERLKRLWNLNHVLVRGILKYAELDFPRVLVDCSSYDISLKITNPMNIQRYERSTIKTLDENTEFIKRTWYPKIVNIMRKNFKKHALTLPKWRKVLQCSKGLINRQFNIAKMRTMDDLIDMVLDRERIPMFAYELVCAEEAVVMEPGYEAAKECFSEIIDHIIAVGVGLETLEMQLDRYAFPTKDTDLPIGLNDLYVQEFKERLYKCLGITYTPVLRYVEDFQNKYYELYSRETTRDVTDFLSQPREFQEYFSRIRMYHNYISMLRGEVNVEYFDVAVITKTKAIKTLREIADSLIDIVTKQIVLEHIKEQEEICEIFEAIKRKALEEPRSTEQLLENGQYVLFVKTVQIHELHERVEESLKIGAELFELTELSDAHIELQRNTINWLEDIKLVFEQNASMFETYKFHFEEHLKDVAAKLRSDISETIPQVSIINDMYDPEKFRDYFILLQNFIDQLILFDDYVAWINKEEKLFQFPRSEYADLTGLKEFLVPFTALMKLCVRWLRYYYVWMDGPFEYLQPKFVEETTEEFFNEFLKTQKYYRNRIKQDLVSNPICQFRGKTEDPDPENHPVPIKLCVNIIQRIKDFRLGVFIVSIMCNQALRPRHWKEMSEIVGFDITPDAGTTLRKIINFDIDDKLDSLEIISAGANKELQLQNNLKIMIAEWANVDFPLGPYKDTGLTILSSLDDVQALLDDHIIKTLSMRGSAFVKPCEAEVRAWYDKLDRVNRTFDEWGRVQANFLYLLPIFSSKDIVAQMPEEGRLFTQVDQTYRRYMTMVMRQPNVMETAPSPGLLEAMEAANKMLDDITNGVNNYLEKKRLYFGRFFFLSNDEMLEILSETKNPLRVQPHLNKCFEGIYRLDFDEQLNVLAMRSSDQERIAFVTPVSTAAAGGSVEKWLLGVEIEMLGAVQNEITLSYLDYIEKKRSLWVLDWGQMVVLCVSQVFWAADVHNSLETRNQALIRNFFGDLTSNLNEIVALIRSKDITNLNRITIKSLIVIDVHARDVVEDLIEEKVHSEADFRWLAQLRYYYEGGKALVRIINATVEYANEYLGNSDRLVITPLTDRCYRTLVGAYQLHLNGAPEGPAGTGKTETTKDLAKALAVQCKVFNCSDGLDYKAMGKFFKGLACCGAWACFDEFNRIELEVLSVVAQQILSIIQAVRANLSKFVFEGTELNLNPACYVCITMNPGYAGRSELPDNLKVLFRSVAMMVPDYAMIGEISLYSYGFVNARALSVKIVTTYRLCSEQLSSQNHYDYGMRAVKTVLSACGNIKKAFPDENEEILLLRSLLDVNLPKFLSFDIPLFEGIISDLFPGVHLPQPDYTLITNAFNEVCVEMNLQPKECFLTKVIQTFEMMIVRHGFMMVGDPMAGKSCTLKALARILSKLKKIGGNPYFQDVHMGIVNPKSITMGQLYGAFDPISYEWTDGISAVIFRNFATDTTDDRKWLIFDGPVDAVWIENMNTVLDDNKKLCLTSGEVVTMSNSMSMIFEVMDLAQASPATVSRCGMIYMEPVTLGWEAFAESWLNQCDPRWAKPKRSLVMEMLRWTIPTSAQFIRKNCKQLLQPGEFSVLRTTFDIFEMLISEAIDENPEEYERFLEVWFEAALLYALLWGLGGILDADSREKFDVFQKSVWNGQSKEALIPEIVGQIEISIPLEGLLVDYVYVFNQKGAWKYWPDIVRRMEPEESASGIQVPTIDTGRYMHLLELHIKYKKKMLLVGPTGTGKSSYMQNLLMNNLSEDCIPAFITFTVMISANQTQNLFISKLVKRKRGIYGSPKGKTTIIFVDDMNMPEKEIYGAQPPLELLRQYFDYRHWYDLKDTSKIYLNDILIMCACGLPGGSRQDVYPRFLCHFNIFSINTFAEETVNRIFAAVLLNGFRKGGHASDAVTSVNQIVNATQQVYKVVCKGLLPTPAKSHYVFNVRDIARICIGCSLMRKESVENRKMFAKVWYHECLRVFYDRLIDEVDQAWLFEVLNDAMKDHFKEKVEIIFDNFADENRIVKLEAVTKLVFGSFMDEDSAQDEKRYEEIPFDVYTNFAYRSLDEFNSTRRSKMNIVLFTYALQHLNKICRVMSMQGGSALLVGIGGSGRQSLTKLAASMCGESLFQPEITKNYGVNDWHDDIKKLLKEAGGAGKHSAFLITENQIKMELFLQDIDCLLNQGEVPNIFAVDERQEVLEMVRLAAQGGNRNIDVSPLQVFSFFVNRCKQKLHIILCFSPIGSALRTRIRLYPSLVNCCTIDWFQLWPQEALQMVAERYMTKVELLPEVKRASVTACEHFHITANEIIREFFADSGRIIYITSASFLELIKSFQNLVTKKQKEIMSAKMRYLGGLETLQKASAAIELMSTELSSLQPKLEALAENSRKMLIEINTETIAAEAATEQVKKDEIVANAQAESAQVLKAECEKDLAEVIPILDEALAALDTIKAADITLLKSMTNPPAVVKLVMAAVCIIKGVTPDRIADPASGRMVNDYWGPSKRLLSDMGFMNSLKNFDKDNIKPEIIAKIRKEYIPHKDFKPSIVAKASSAAEGMCKWIIAMDLYESAAKIVAPKKARLAMAEKEYSDTMALLTEKRNMAKALEEKVARLNEDLEKANAQMQKTSDEVELCKNKLFRAQALIGGLGGEKSRWTLAAENLQSLYECIPGDILISCGIIAYLAALTAPYRNKCVDDWFNRCKGLKIPCSSEYNFVNVLGSDITVQSWNISGLPSDAFSSENAVIMDSSSRYSLFIDPQGQANKWLKNLEKNNRLQVVKFSQGNYMKVIEQCIESGWPVLIENVQEDLEVPLDPILNRNTFIQGGNEYISLGDNVIQMSPKFRMYITSNLRNPHYLPETFNKATIINFALTQQGLEDQLLGIVVAKERPELQELRQALITENARNRAMLKEAEDKILETLSSSEGDILENEKAIQILDDSKILAADIKIKQATSKETEMKIESFRQNYRSVAALASVLYYTITDLPNIDPMYQFSLNWYINLYIYSIENANKSKDLQRRLKFLTDAITINLYNNVCRSIFEKDKLLYSFILTTKIMLANKQIGNQEFMHLLTGGGPLANQERNPDTTWITEIMWTDICKLEQLPHLSNFLQTFLSKLQSWRTYYDSAEPHRTKLPEPWNQRATAFEKIIILKAFRPDKVFLGITDFVSEEMGSQFISPPPFDIAKSYEDSNFLSPLIFILSPGADPMGSLLLFAEKMNYDETFQSISLGQGQGPIARKMIEDAQVQGTWVCLQNCHLAASWMPSLEFLWENMDIYNTQSSFRLWLTSYPSEQFPVALLQNGVKMTNEPPTGLQQNLLRSYNSEPMNDEKFYNGCPNKDRAFTRLLYGICFFHAVVQERRKFGPLGWNIPYGFNESDFQISVQQLQMFLNQYDDIQYAAISYLTAECNYGGRVTDAWDRRAIVTILADYVNDEVVNNLRYTFAPGEEYALPRKSEHREVIRYIEENIPPMPSPEVYGLHPNAGITRDLQTSTLLLDSMILTLGRVASAGSGDTEKILLDTVRGIYMGLPADFDLETAKQVYPVDYNESMNTVLVQEMERFNKLLRIVRTSCKELEKAIKGMIAMTPDLEDVSIAISLNKIPGKWAKNSYPSLKPLGSYVQDFIGRLSWLQKWFDHGKPPTFWLSGFYFTQAFLTGAMQNYARKYRIPIDTLTFDFEVLSVRRMDMKPEDGVFINGLFLEGAKWKSRLDEQDPKTLIEEMPCIHFMPILITELKEGNRYKCPLYKTAERRGTLSTTGHSTNYVLPILLGTLKPPSHWVKRSVALICQTSS